MNDRLSERVCVCVCMCVCVYVCVHVCVCNEILKSLQVHLFWTWHSDGGFRNDEKEMPKAKTCFVIL